MSDPAPLWRTLLDGRYRWGTAMRETGRYGAESIHLRIYPPGSSTIMRRFARITRLWPFVGAGLTLLAVLLVPPLVDVTTAFAFITTLSFIIVIWAVLAGISTPVRKHTVSFLATMSTLTPQEDSRRRYEYAIAVYLRLEQAESLYDRGAIQWDEYRAEWARAHDMLQAY